MTNNKKHIQLQENIKARYLLIDQIRGLAVLLMIIFHLFYDLNLFQFVKIDFHKNPFWWTLPRFIVFLFLFSVGLSLCEAHFPQVRWNKFWKRFLKLASAAALISISTYFMFPKSWIYFGTLHCIALASLVILPLLKYPRINLVIALANLIPALIFKKAIPFPTLHTSMDYIPLFPWIGVVCLGVSAWHYNFHKVSIPHFPWEKFLGALGKHAFIIYLAHQPILYSLIFLLSKAFSS